MCTVIDDRGVALIEVIKAAGLVVCNDGDAPAFVRGTQVSHIDVTFASESVYSKLRSREVMEETILSDHVPILFDFRGRTNKVSPPIRWIINDGVLN